MKTQMIHDTESSEGINQPDSHEGKQGQSNKSLTQAVGYWKLTRNRWPKCAKKGPDISANNKPKEIMNIDSAFPSKYMKSSDLPEDGVAVPFTITEVQTEEIGKEKQMKPVIYFKGHEKGMVANKTNCNTIAKALSSRDTDDWVGKTILLYSTEVQFGDEMVESIRVKLKAGKAASKPVEDEEVPF